MSYKGLFIGVNKYLDRNISDLNGARRDAEALYGLFLDTLDNEISAELLVDTDATCQAVKENMEKLLLKASIDDTVIITFSGHGSTDHYIVLHDTDSGENFSESALEMSQIAEYFSESKAKNIILILDCCFSGGAANKVFSLRPKARNMTNVFQSISGEGRLLISASDYDQPAWENGILSHGLLTQSLIDEFRENTKSVGVLKVIDSVFDRVRAYASKISVIQTPILVGTIKGGLKFPVFKVGKVFSSFFPETLGLKTDGSIESLIHYGIPTDVIDIWKNRFNNHPLNELQITAINNYQIMEGNSLLVIAPTSSGKTFIGEVSGVKSVLEGKKTVFLFPYKALTNEKFDDFSKIYSESLNLRIIRVTGDTSDYSHEFLYGKYDIALLTYEMFLSLVVSNPDILRSIGHIVLDEAQFITDPTRGITVELILTLLLSKKAEGISPQLIILSAVIGDTNYFGDWLELDSLITDKRPIPLVEGVIDRNGIYQFLDEVGKVNTQQFINPVTQRTKKKSSQDIIVPLIQKLMSDDVNEKVIIFRNTRGTAQGCSGYIADSLNFPMDALSKQLPELDRSNSSQKLIAVIDRGAAFHTSDLNTQEKELVEKTFRDPSSSLKILVATSGVAAGVNTPASTVIVAESYFQGKIKTDYLISQYKNMVGRAGRLGFNEKGRSILLAESSLDRERLFSKYVLGELEPLKSSFVESDIDTWIIKLLSQVKEIKKEDVSYLLLKTYGGYLRNRENPDWSKLMSIKINDLLDNMIGLDLLNINEGNIYLTVLGEACGSASFSLQSAMNLVSLLKTIQNKDFSPENILALIQIIPEVDDLYIPFNAKYTAESKWRYELSNSYSSNILHVIDRQARTNEEVNRRHKKLFTLMSWIEGFEKSEIEHKMFINYYNTVSSGVIVNLANSNRFHMRSAVKIAQTVHQVEDEAFDNFMIRLEFGIPQNFLFLTKREFNLTRGEILEVGKINLTESYFESPESLERLENLVGKDKAILLKDYFYDSK